jgi:2-hydroxychromene-2-carboxylate isomerase
MSQENQTDADIWFDSLCPWSWTASRWLLEVQSQRPIGIRWHVMSLYVLNEGSDIPPRYRQLVDSALGPGRVCIAAEQQYGSAVLGRLYTELGTRFHHEKEPADQVTVAAALRAAGLDPGLASAMESTDYDEALHVSHHNAMERVGYDVGTPVISVEGTAFFGPVVTPIPRGEAAVRLWDGVRLVAGTEGFYELKRTRDVQPIFD